MVSLDTLKKIATAFVEDACKYVGMENDVPRVIFTPRLDLSPISPLFTVTNDNSIVVSEEALTKNCQAGCTPLRLYMTAAVRLVEQRRKLSCGEWRANGVGEALCYAHAILLLKGLLLPDLSVLGFPIKDKIPPIIKTEFGLSCKLRRIPRRHANEEVFLGMQMTCQEEEREEGRQTKKETFTSFRLEDSEKGGIDNPFDNIYQAINFLRKEERRAYEADERLHEIENARYYYDLNWRQFRIPWAWPHVAHLKNNFPENAFVMSQMAPPDRHRPDIFYFSLKPNLYRHKFLYRGQSYHYPGKPCVPNMYRDEEHNEAHDYLDFLIFAQEMELVIKSHPIVNMLDKGIVLLHDVFRMRMHYPGLAQHYYNKSCYLDLTSELDVMSFFATTGYDAASDQYYPFTDTSKLGVIYYYELKFPEAFQVRDGYALKTIGKQVFVRSGLQRGFLLEMNRGVDFKQLPEVRAVYFKHDPKISEEIFAQSEKGKRFFGEDILQHAWHDRLKKRYDNKVVSMEAVRLNVSRNEGETEQSITQKLKQRNIAVDDHKPAFTEEELRGFYQNIDKWWEDFCDDIHFVDPEDELYRQAMRDLPKDPRYGTYFRMPAMGKR